MKRRDFFTYTSTAVGFSLLDGRIGLLEKAWAAPAVTVSVASAKDEPASSDHSLEALKKQLPDRIIQALKASGNLNEEALTQALKNPARITEAAVDALGGMKQFVSRGDVVVIKPNIGWDRAPEYAANTNPEVVGQLIRMAFDAGAQKVKVFDRTVNDPRRCYKHSGIKQKAKSLGAEVSYIDDRKFSDTAIPQGQAIQEWPLYKELLEADKIINVPIAKHHSLAKLTMALKNWMGVMGGRRGRIHHDIGTKLADLSTVIKPTLTVLDAIRILTQGGPQGGNLNYVQRKNKVIASTDQVAVDTFGASLFNIDPMDLTYIKNARSRGLGVTRIKEMNLKRVWA